MTQPAIKADNQRMTWAGAGVLAALAVASIVWQLVAVVVLAALGSVMGAMLLYDLRSAGPDMTLQARMVMAALATASVGSAIVAMSTSRVVAQAAVVFLAAIGVGRWLVDRGRAFVATASHS